MLDESQANLAASPNALFRPGLEDATAAGEALRRDVEQEVVQAKTAEFYALGVVLGYCYRNSPVIVDDGSGARRTRSRDYVPSPAPGCLAPHHWLADGRSLYDLFGPGFTLLALDAAEEDVATAMREAAATKVPVTIVRCDDPTLRYLYGEPLTLIRPDQHVAWRGRHWPKAGLLSTVAGRP